jgi:hypothetical protein
MNPYSTRVLINDEGEIVHKYRTPIEGWAPGNIGTSVIHDYLRGRQLSRNLHGKADRVTDPKLSQALYKESQV